jgi:hypothetical protein
MDGRLTLLLLTHTATRLRTSCTCPAVNERFLPLYTPAFFARAMPSRCLSRIMLLSKSATAPRKTTSTSDHSR